MLEASRQRDAFDITTPLEPFGLNPHPARPPLTALDTLRLKTKWVLNVKEIEKRLLVAVADPECPLKDKYKEALHAISQLDGEDPDSVSQILAPLQWFVGAVEGKDVAELAEGWG